MNIKNILSWSNTIIGIIGIIIGLIGITSSVYFYNSSIKEREPIILEESFRPTVISTKSIETSPLKVINSNGNVIDKDVSLIKFYFWNAGKESIKKSNILSPIEIELSATDIQIIDIKILSISRPKINKPEINLANNKSNAINISFNILEKNDGFSVQLLYIGTHNAPLITNGVIEGVAYIQSNDDISISYFYKDILVLSIFISLALFISTYIYIPIIRITRNQELLSPILKKKIKLILPAYFILLLLTIYIIYHYTTFQINKGLPTILDKNQITISLVPKELIKP